MAKNKLKNLLLKELSLVGRGANQHARVNLFKSADGKPGVLGRLFGVTKSDEPDYVEALATSVNSIIKAQGLDPQERLDLLDTSLDQFKEAVLTKAAEGDLEEEDDTDEEDTSVTKDEDDEGDDDEPEETIKKHTPDAGATTGESHTPSEGSMKVNKEQVLKGASPEVLAYVEAVEKEAKDNAEKAAAIVEKAANDERIAVAKSLVTGIPVKAEDLAAVLKQLDAPGQETVRAIVAKTAEFAKAADLFEEAGSAATDAPAPISEVEKQADEFQKQDPKLTRAQAIRKAFESNPDAYEASLNK